MWRIFNSHKRKTYQEPVRINWEGSSFGFHVHNLFCSVLVANLLPVFFFFLFSFFYFLLFIVCMLHNGPRIFSTAHLLLLARSLAYLIYEPVVKCSLVWERSPYRLYLPQICNVACLQSLIGQRMALLVDKPSS